MDGGIIIFLIVGVALMHVIGVLPWSLSWLAGKMAKCIGWAEDGVGAGFMLLFVILLVFLIIIGLVR